MAVQADVPLAGLMDPLDAEQVEVLADSEEPKLLLDLLEELELLALG